MVNDQLRHQRHQRDGGRPRLQHHLLFQGERAWRRLALLHYLWRSFGERVEDDLRVSNCSSAHRAHGYFI